VSQKLLGQFVTSLEAKIAADSGTATAEAKAPAPTEPEALAAAATTDAAPMTLRVRWDNGEESRVDVSGMIESFRVYAPLRQSPDIFSKVQVGEHGTDVVWPQGIDMSADTLWRLAQEQSGATMTPDEFRHWRERKASSTPDPAREQGVSSSGHDQYEERLEHNRERFLAETGRLAGDRLRERGIDDVLVFGSPEYWREFADGTAHTQLHAELADRNDLISAPIGRLLPEVSAAVERARVERDRAVVERALGQADGVRPGALGPQETAEALLERRVEHLVYDAALGERAEELVRGAVEGAAAITTVRDELAELLARCEGVAAVLRY